jgi:hypothetical protein
MNPWSLIFIGFGLILIYVGWKGSQKNVFATLLGHSALNAAPTAKTSSSNSGSTSNSSSQATNASTGNNGSTVKP